MTFENHLNYNCQVTLDDGDKFMLYSNWLHNENYDHWQGWHCDAGRTRIIIDDKLNVYSGECKNDYLGNIKTGWELLNNGTTCKRERCTGCTDDLIVRKFKGE